MHYRGGSSLSPLFPLSPSFSLSSHLSFFAVVLAPCVVLSSLDLLSISATFRRQKRGHMETHYWPRRYNSSLSRNDPWMCAPTLIRFLSALPAITIEGLQRRLSLALTIMRWSPPPHPSAVPWRERIASSRSIVHYEKQKCAARQWRDPWPRRTIDLTIYIYIYIYVLSRSLSRGE